MWRKHKTHGLSKRSILHWRQKKSRCNFQRLWILEKDISKMKCTKNINFPEARKILRNVEKIHTKHKLTGTPNTRKQPSLNKTRSNYPTYKWDENTNSRNENYNENCYWKSTLKIHQTKRLKQGEPKCPLFWSGLYCEGTKGLPLWRSDKKTTS